MMEAVIWISLLLAIAIYPILIILFNLIKYYPVITDKIESMLIPIYKKLFKSSYYNIVDSIEGLQVALILKVANISENITEDQMSFIHDEVDSAVKLSSHKFMLKRSYLKIIEKERYKFGNVESLSKKLKELSLNDTTTLYFIETLLELSFIDPSKDNREEEMVEQIANLLGIGHEEYNIIKKDLKSQLHIESDEEEKDFENENSKEDPKEEEEEEEEEKISKVEEEETTQEIKQITKPIEVLQKKKKEEAVETVRQDIIIEKAVKDTVEEDIIKKSYKRLMKQYDKKNLKGKSKDDIKYAEEKSRKLKEAYEALRKS